MQDSIFIYDLYLVFVQYLYEIVFGLVVSMVIKSDY